MKIKSFSRKMNPSGERGQSLVELALVVTLLMFITVGIVEYGFMLNQYLNVADAAREAARQGAGIDPFQRDDSGGLILDVDGHRELYPTFFVRPDLSQPPNNEPPESPTANNAGLSDFVEDFLGDVHLDPDTDDIVISIFSVNSDLTMVRYPLENPMGWSRFNHHESRFTNADVAARMDSGTPPSGVLLVEIYYNYHQRLKLPIFNILDPYEVYCYAIMPLSAAEP